jgi:hypothetical protein
MNGNSLLLNGNTNTNNQLGDDTKQQQSSKLIPPPGFVQPTSKTPNPTTTTPPTRPTPPPQKPTPPPPTSSSAPPLDPKLIEDPKNLANTLKSIFPNVNISIGAPSYQQQQQQQQQQPRQNSSEKQATTSSSSSSSSSSTGSYWPDDPAIVSLTDQYAAGANSNASLLHPSPLHLLNNKIQSIYPNDSLYDSFNKLEDSSSNPLFRLANSVNYLGQSASSSSSSMSNLDSNVAKLTQLEQFIQQQQHLQQQQQQQQQQFLSYQLLMQQLQHLPQQQQQLQQFGINSANTAATGEQLNILKNIANQTSMCRFILLFFYYFS